MALFCDQRSGGVKRWSLGPPEDIGLRIPNEYTLSVAFLAIEDGHGDLRNVATAFFVNVGIGEVIFTYLVTAKHSIEGARSIGRPLYLRVNGMLGGVQKIPVLDDWEIHPDSGVDLAVQSFEAPATSESEFAYRQVPLSMLATPETIRDRGIGVGDETCIIGLYYQNWGNTGTKLEPIVRSGTIASMPIAPFIHGLRANSFGLSGSYQAILVEARSCGGLSGSPVFAVLPMHRDAAANPVAGMYQPVGAVHNYLLGVVSGHFEDDDIAKDVLFEPERGLVNTGIAIVTPAHLMVPILESEKFTKEREGVLASLGHALPQPTLDIVATA